MRKKKIVRVLDSKPLSLEEAHQLASHQVSGVKPVKVETLRETYRRLLRAYKKLDTELDTALYAYVGTLTDEQREREFPGQFY